MGEGRGPQPRVVIVGAGLAGSLLATLLGRRGIAVQLFERRPDPRLAGAERGRSINLALSARGLAALEQVGLRDEVMKLALPMRGRMIHDVDGGQNLQPYSADGTRSINSISRALLNATLLDAADATPGVTIRFGHRLTELDLDDGLLTFDTDAGPVPERADVVLACDGSYSAARRAVTFRQGFTFGQDYLGAGYRELTIPATAAGEFAMDPAALHIWPRGESMMIALPNADRSFTCTLFWPTEQLESLRTDGEVLGYFRRHYPDAVELMPSLAEDYRLNPAGSLVTVRCRPWVHRGSPRGEGDGGEALLALVGDAAHAIVPFFGQGANCGMEDCIEIDAQLAACGGDWATALERYQCNRKPNTDAIAELSLDNFVEMRDRVNSPVYRAKMASQHWLERRLPGRYVSRYELVSFSTTPYADIAGRMRRQNRATAGAAGAVTLAALAAARAWQHRRDEAQ